MNKEKAQFRALRNCFEKKLGFSWEILNGSELQCQIHTGFRIDDGGQIMAKNPIPGAQ